MKLLISLIILLTANPLIAKDNFYNFLDKGYLTKGAEINVPNITPVKSQDGVGHCYGFTATSLLEQYRCREMKLDCSDPKNFLSSLDVTSYFKNRSLAVGGDTFKILSNVQSSERKIASEECASFSSLVHTMTDAKNVATTNESRGMLFLTQKWNEYKGRGADGRNTTRNDCVTCMADTIKATLVNIKTPADQIRKAFYSAYDLNDFLYKSILPLECLEEKKLLKIPPFVTKTFPNSNENFSEDGLSKKVESLLMSNIPLEMGVCASSAKPCPPAQGHSITLVGIKEACKGSDCRVMVKIKNSYGMSWQQENNQGWVELKSLVSNSGNYTQGLFYNKNISWVENPSFVLKEQRMQGGRVTPVTTVTKKIISNTSSTLGTPDQYKDYKGTWKCPGSNFTDHYEPGCVPLK